MYLMTSASTAKTLFLLTEEMYCASHNNYDIILKLSLPNPATEGGANLSIFTSFFVSVGASIVAYYICKWLDRHK